VEYELKQSSLEHNRSRPQAFLGYDRRAYNFLCSMNALPQNTFHQLTTAEIADSETIAIAEEIKARLIPEQIQSTAKYLQNESKLLDHIAILVAQKVVLAYRQQLGAKSLSDHDIQALPSLEISLNQSERTLEVKTNLNREKLLSQISSLLRKWLEDSQIWTETAENIWSHLILWEIEDFKQEANVDAIDAVAITELETWIRESLQDERPTLNKRLQVLEERYAQEIAEKAYQTLKLGDYEASKLEKLLGINLNSSKRKTPRTEVSLSKIDKIAPIPTGLPIVSSISAQLRADLWQPDEAGVAYFRYHARSNQKNYLEHYITSPGDIETLPWEAAEQIINKFGFNTVKLQMILAAHAMRQSKPWESTFTLKATDIIEELGWDKNHGSNLPTKRNEVASIAYALSCLLVKSVWIEGRGKTQVDASTPIGRMWEILIDSQGQFDFVTGRVEQPEEVYITIRPGLWTAHFLNQAGSKAKEALYQFGYLALNILKIDPYHDELALRLAIHLTLDVRIRARDRNPYEYKVRSLLGCILPETVIQEAIQNSDKARNLFKRWNHAAQLLGGLGWRSAPIQEDETRINADEIPQGVFYTHPYPEWMDPESKVKKPRGWIEQWLEQKLIICPPHPIPERMQSLSRAKAVIPKRLKGKAPTPLSKEDIKAARKAKGWTQAKLAGTVGVDQSLIAKVESGKRAISDDLASDLRQVLSL
jgi:DNA-binding XRE family transcriptional regulator